MGEARVNLDQPRWDQSTYWGRARHFFTTTNPLNLLATPSDLEKAKEIVESHRLDKMSDQARTVGFKQKCTNISFKKLLMMKTGFTFLHSTSLFGCTFIRVRRKKIFQTNAVT